MLAAESLHKAQRRTRKPAHTSTLLSPLGNSCKSGPQRRIQTAGEALRHDSAMTAGHKLKPLETEHHSAMGPASSSLSQFPQRPPSKNRAKPCETVMVAIPRSPTMHMVLMCHSVESHNGLHCILSEILSDPPRAVTGSEDFEECPT